MLAGGGWLAFTDNSQPTTNNQVQKKGCMPISRILSHSLRHELYHLSAMLIAQHL